jgi:hypothetical protein
MRQLSPRQTVKILKFRGENLDGGIEINSAVAETERRTRTYLGAGWTWRTCESPPCDDPTAAAGAATAGSNRRAREAKNCRALEGIWGIFVCAAKPFTGFKSTPPSDWNICCDGGECDEWEKGAVEGRGLVGNDRIAPGYWWDTRGTCTKTGIRGSGWILLLLLPYILL